MQWTPPSFSLRQVQYALAVAETAGFGKAAKLCHVSQPALSAQVAQLEEALGVVLFERSSSAIRTRPGAQGLLERMRMLVADAAALQRAATQVADPLAGQLRIGVIPTISPYLVPLLVGPVREAFPKLRPIWMEQPTPVIRRALHDGSLDAALVALEAEYGTVDHEVLGTDSFLFAAPKGHRLGRGRAPLSISCLKHEDVLLLEDGHCMRDQVQSFCQELHEHDAGVRATSLTTLAQMVAGGLGVTLLPQLAVAQENAHGRLSCRTFAEPAPARTIVLVWRRHSAWAEPMREISEVMRRAAEGVLLPAPG
jgi:LysR family transcriptional regulator, hydrogen peroxide-inducible genes activator